MASNNERKKNSGSDTVDSGSDDGGYGGSD